MTDRAAYRAKGCDDGLAQWLPARASSHVQHVPKTTGNSCLALLALALLALALLA